MSEYKGYSKEVREKVPNHKTWQGLVMFLMFTTFFLFLDCLFDWSFNIWLPIFFVLFLVVSHRYGTLLKKADEELKMAKIPAHIKVSADDSSEQMRNRLFRPKSCPSPEWIQIKGHTDYEIHCENYDVRHRTHGYIVFPGNDPYGVDDEIWLDLYNGRRTVYVKLKDIVRETLGRKV